MKTVHRFFGVVLSIAYLGSAGVAHAATYYVSKAGSNSNSCTQAQSLSTPKLTINAGIGCLSVGDTLLVRAGDYDEGISSIPSGTSWSNKVRIAGYPGTAPFETVWLRPLVHGVGNPGGVVRLNAGNEHYIEFDGINMDGRNVGYGAVTFVIDASGESHHIRIQNAELIGRTTDNSAYSAYAANVLEIHGGKPTMIGGFEFRYLTIHGGGRPCSPCSFADNGYGIYLAAPNNLVENCDIYDNKGAGIHVYNDDGASPNNNIIRNTRIHDLTRRSVIGQVWGILVAGANNQIYNNLIYSINVGDTDPGEAGVAISGSSNKVYNNTLSNNTNSGIYLGGGASNTEVKNNIVYASTGSNFVNGGSGTIQSNNLFGVDPRFVNTSAKNFQLQAASPAVNAGTSLSIVTKDFAGVARPQGAAYDIGAYEYGGGLLASLPGAPTGLRILSP